MSATTTVQLAKPIAKHLRAGHPWIFDEALEPSPDISTGTMVEVVDRKGRFVGHGIFDAESPLRVRLWSLEREEPIDAALVETRVRKAVALRRREIAPAVTDALRLVHGEADRLPGVVVDRYGDWAIVRLDTPAIGRLRPALSAALLAAQPDLRGIVEQRARAEGPANLRLLTGQPLPEELIAREHGILYEVDPRAGHKTGLYLDQRDNRKLCMELAGEKTVLNMFCYTGGFSLTAAMGGAMEVTSVDIAEPVITAARRNFERNGLGTGDPGYRFIASDAVAWLERDRRNYDVVVLDPPSLAPHKAARQRGLDHYRRINQLALRRLQSGGQLMTFSCSSHVTQREFEGAVHHAARDSGRRIEIRHRLGAAPDHPVQPWFPEGDYLHGLLLVVRATWRG